MTYRKQISLGLLSGLLSLSTIATSASAAGSCSSYEAKLASTDRKLSRFEDRLDLVQQKNETRIAKWDFKIADANGQINLANELKDNCTDIGNILLGILLSDGKRYKFSSITKCMTSADKMKVRAQSRKLTAQQKKGLTEQQAARLLERAQARVDSARTARDAAQTALNQCQNPPPAP